jgi:photosystem II stability/assembly factor-like uncharacterized protein
VRGHQHLQAELPLNVDLQRRSGDDELHGVRAVKPALSRAYRCCLGALFTCAITIGAAARAVAQERIETPRLRLQYLEAQRAYPFDRIPPGALQRARRDLYRRFPDLLNANAAARAGARAAPVWEPLGPARIAAADAGRLVAIAIDPRNPQVMYVGGAQGGVWKTLDGGASWTPRTDGACSLAMGSIALDPANPDIIYAGTGELHFSGDSYYGCGVLRSIDGGNTWEQLGASLFDTSDGGARIARVIVDPHTAGSASSSVLHVASSFGVFRSINSGATWSRTLNGVVVDLVMNPADPRVLYAAIGEISGGPGNGVYRSTDSGITWTRLSGGFPVQEVGRITLAIAPAAPAVLYAAIQDAFGGSGASGTLLGIWKTQDSGATWIRLTATGASCDTQCWYDLLLAVHPVDANIVYFGGVQLFRSTDGGARFQNILGNIHVDQHAFAFHPDNAATVFAGNDGGIYRSRDGGNTWTSLNTNIAITQFYNGISLHPLQPDYVLAGTQDNGTLEYSGNPDWNRVEGGDGGFTATDFVDPATSYVETQWTPFSGHSGPRRRSSFGFYELKVNGINTGDRALFIPPLVMDGTDPHVLYFGTFRLYRTANRGESWSGISGDLSSRGGVISAIAAAPSDPATLYVGTSDANLVVSRDLGATWTPRGTGLPDRYVRDIDIALNDPLDAVVVFSGFGTGHVFRTSNGGASWTNISGDLADVPVNAVLRHPALGQQILIGTDLGVFRTLDNGATWTPYNDGFPNVAVFDLAYGSATGRIVAATHGRGAFALSPVLETRVVIAPDTLRFAALGDTATLSAVILAPDGTPLGSSGALWLSLDADIATVNAQGRVRAVGNGRSTIIATASGSADSATVEVRQIVAAIAGLPDRADLVVDETVNIAAHAVDARGNPVAGEIVSLRSSDPAILQVEVGGQVRALREGSAFLIAELASRRDSAEVRIAPPAVLRVDASAATNTNSSARRGTRIALLRLSADVEGIEAVLLTQLTFEVTGNDPAARLLVLRDLARDGMPDANDPLIAAMAAPLEDQPRTLDLSDVAFTVPADTIVELLVVLEMGGRAPNGTSFSARFVPAGVRSLNTRSGRINRLTLPTAPVASSEVSVTVLGAGEALSLSENPVRSARLIFNFAARPRTAAVYTVGGRRVADLLRITGDARIEWDLTNDQGARIAPGVYLVLFDIDGNVMRQKLVIATPGEEADPG